MLALLMVNNVAGLALAPRYERTKVTYTFFRQQVQARNVSEIESRNDTIQGNLRKAVRYPASSTKPTEVKRFETVRPSLGDDALLTMLLDKGVSVNAKPLDQGRPL